MPLIRDDEVAQKYIRALMGDDYKIADNLVGTKLAAKDKHILVIRAVLELHALGEEAKADKLARETLSKKEQANIVKVVMRDPTTTGNSIDLRKVLQKPGEVKDSRNKVEDYYR